MKKLFLLCAVGFLCSCGKSDTIPPVITILAPADNSVVSGGQAVQVQAKCEDETGLHMVHIMVLDQAGGHIKHEEIHYDGKEYTLNQSFTAQTGKIYTIEVGATDHHDNDAKKTVTITAN